MSTWPSDPLVFGPGGSQEPPPGLSWDSPFCSLTSPISFHRALSSAWRMMAAC